MCRAGPVSVRSVGIELSLATGSIVVVRGAGLGSLDNPKLSASCRKVPNCFSFCLLPVVQVLQGVRPVTARAVAVHHALGEMV